MLKARQLYVECQAFLLWVRAIEDSEGHFPERLVEIVPKRFPGFLRFAEQQSATCTNSLVPNGTPWRRSKT